MIRYYWNIIKRITSISTSSMLAYRSNILFFFLFETFFLMGNLGGLALGVQLAGGQLAGWSLNQVMFIATLYGVGHQIFTTFMISGIFHTGFYVWTGRMDYVLLKPLHPLISMHAANEFIISNIPNLVLNTVLFILFCIRLDGDGVPFTLVSSLGLLLFFTAGIAVRYGIGLLVVAPAFFAEKLAEGEDAYWSLQSLAKYPSGVFPKMMQWVFSFLLPVASIASIPSEVYFGTTNVETAATHLVAAILFAILTLKFYELGAKKYQSVNTGA